MERLVEAKIRLNSKIDLQWRFLTFSHNLGEVERAIEMAEELGLDSIFISTPSDVSWDDPEVRVAESEHIGLHVFSKDETRSGSLPKLEGIFRGVIDELFEIGWVGRMIKSKINDEPINRNVSTCDWLYFNVTLDAVGRIMPCCAPPPVHSTLVFGNINNEFGMNTQYYKLARLSFTDKSRYFDETKALSKKPYCADCPGGAPLQFDRAVQVPISLYYLDGSVLLNQSAIQALSH